MMLPPQGVSSQHSSQHSIDQDSDDPPPLWRFAQCFGDKNETGDLADGKGSLFLGDMISCLKFDPSGQFLATGDRAGRVVLFERTHDKNEFELRFLHEFQSHESEFDYLKSTDISERIGQIAWCPRVGPSLGLLTANEKSIRFWKLAETPSSMVLDDNRSMSKKLQNTDVVQIPLMLPKMIPKETAITARQRFAYGPVHAYNINSLSPCPQEPLFLSADDLRINLWHYDRREEAFALADIKPERVENLYEVITRAHFHSHLPHIYAYGTSRGCLRVGDMRMCSSLDRPLRNFDSRRASITSDPALRIGLFAEALASISDFAFHPRRERLFATRDFLTIKLWDMANETMPVAIYPIHDYLRGRLGDLYESEALFDRFDLDWSANGGILTGSYGSLIKHFYQGTSSDSSHLAFRADRTIFRSMRKYNAALKSNSSSSSAALDNTNGVCERLFPSNQQSFVGFLGLQHPHDINLERRIQHLSCHPTEAITAVASLTNLFIFSAGKTRHQQH